METVEPGTPLMEAALYRDGPAKAACGHVQVIFGPMFSGKTTELLRRVRRHTFANKKCVVIKYANDKRYSEDLMATHDRQTWAAVSASRLSDVAGLPAAATNAGVEEGSKNETRSLIADAEVIGIDEGQFFPDLVETCERFANEGKIVIVAALDGTFQRKPFESTLGLIAISESVSKLTAVCMGCYRPASFSKRLGSETAIEVIGGADKYVAACRECFHDDQAFRRPNGDMELTSVLPKRTSPKKTDIASKHLVPMGTP